jgi:hypothetical protein
MTSQRRRTVAFLFSLLILALAAAAFAQDPQSLPRNGRGPRQNALNLPEVERLFDGYVAMQAEEALKLTDAQYPQFLARLKVLQQTRRQHFAARRAIVADLDRAVKASPAADGAIADGLRKLRDLDAKYVDDLRKAYDGVDQILDPTQQARFRVFEETVERRKLDLMLRARRTAQQRQMGQPR